MNGPRSIRRPVLRQFCGFIAAACLYPAAVRAGNDQVQFDEVLAGVNGDSTIQFVELKFSGPGENLWGPQGGESVGRARLVFHDATGLQTGEFVFASDPPMGLVDPVNGGYSVLIATQAFADEPTMPAPDFIMPVNVVSVNGKICFKNNPANANADPIDLCLSYGNFVGDLEGGGTSTSASAIVYASALRRLSNYAIYGAPNVNSDLMPAPPQPRNSAGDTGLFTIAPDVDQGFNLFSKETFYGNGRTCLTCHRPEAHFSITPSLIATLPPNDPLFVAETNPQLAALENSCILRSRGLFLENIDGFANPHVFRASPHLLNAFESAPYGLSGEFSDLQLFSGGAVQQHFPKTLTRNSDPLAGPLDFRLPTTSEKNVLGAFMNSITVPEDGNFDIDRMINAAVARGADAVAINRGRDLFVGDGKCFLCHGGPVLADADVFFGGGNLNFRTGVVNLPVNQSEPCLGGGPLPAEAGGNRAFNVPALIGVSETAPYFHNNSVATLRDTVEFYNGTEFNTSQSGFMVGGITLNAAQVDDITEFLTALVEPDVVDCNSNMVDDVIDVNQGTSLDCNNNKIPDECELAGNDCNGNGTPDDCDAGPIIFSGSAVQTTSDGPFSATAFDLNGDLREDVITANWNANSVTVFLAQPGGTLLPQPNYAVGNLPHAVAVADFDDDGDPDVASCNLATNNVSVLRNNGGTGPGWLGLAAATHYPVGSGPLSLKAVDVNGDMLPDVVTANNVTNNLSVLINLGNSMGNWQGFAPVVNYNTGNGPWYIAAGLLDDDADLDLVTANRGAHNITIRWNNGSGVFNTSTTIAVGSSPEGVCAEDLNGDGKGDLAVANFDSDTITVKLNTGGGTFGPSVNVGVGNYPFGAKPRFVGARDLDGDGDRELISANQFSDSISILLNDGAGTFPAIINIPVAFKPEAVAIGDFDGDGKADVASPHFTNDELSVAINLTPPMGGDCNANAAPDDCDLAAGASFDFNANAIPDECENLGDIDGDGDLDADDIAAFVTVLLGLDTDPNRVAASNVNADAGADAGDVSPFTRLMVANGF
jgi:cytochrome c peroxidase